ncbi:MAG: hypothetical protein ACE5H4_00140 [Candidatus Thorarchaeota archaeon]
MAEERPKRKKHRILQYLREVGRVFVIRRSKLIALGVGLAYLLFYLLATGVFVISSTPLPLEIQISNQWPALIFRERAPFNWEPIGSLSIGFLQVFLSIPNILFGLVIAVLVGINIAVSAYTYSARKVCRINPSASILAAAPALLTGFACCGPTLLISLGLASATISVAFVAIVPFLFPLALGGLVVSFLWSGRKLSQPVVDSEQVLKLTTVTPS